MARALFSHELGDPDFQWLLTTYTEQMHTAVMVDAPCLPIVLLLLTPEEKSAVLTTPALAGVLPGEPSQSGETKEPSTE